MDSLSPARPRRVAAPGPLTGRRLDGRYDMGPALAAGGMATVYSAMDLRLENEVAVKVMHASWAHDPDFVARFGREARSAARIRHPNVVTVTDAGQDGDVVFLVMDLVRGRTLRDLLDERGRLSTEQSLDVLEPVLAALAAAHGGGLVHRDIKPENVLLGDDGVVKVADFGLARAIEDSGLTAHAGLIMGTVAYVSPEQVELGRADPRSDVYSAGVLLFEMLTGQVPFSGDTALTVAYRHVHEHVPAPSTLTRAAGLGGLPAELDDLVGTATALDPDDRFPDGAAFLDAARRTHRAIAAGGAIAGRPAAAGAASAATIVLPPARRPAPVLNPTAVLPAAVPPAAVPPAARVPAVASAVPPAPPARPAAGRGPRRGLRRAIALLLVALLGGGAAVAGWWFADGRYVHAPSLRNLTPAAAEQALTSRHLRYVIGARANDDTVPAGRVAATEPGTGARLTRGSQVTLVLSEGIRMVQVPQVTGLSRSAATAALARAGLPLGQIDGVYNPAADLHAATGTVVGVIPGVGATIRHTQPVTLKVSLGPAPVTAPDVHGETLTQAQDSLTGLGLVVPAPVQAFSNTVATGVVIGQSPPPGAAHQGDTVTLTVSKGPQMVVVPLLRDLTASQASALLRAAGLVPHEDDLLGFRGDVVLQSPGAGSIVRIGSKVTFYTP